VPNAAKTLELFAARRQRQRIARNKSFHNRLCKALRAAKRSDEVVALAQARNGVSEDIARNAGYMRAYAVAAEAAVAAGLKPPPAPRQDEGIEPEVRRLAWDMFKGRAASLCEAYGDDARLILLTVTCRDAPGLRWGIRMGRVTKRRDDVLRMLNRHRAWAASFFDVQKADEATDDFSPHWHVLFVTNADRMPDVVARLNAVRSVALDVAWCDYAAPRRPEELLQDEERRRSWLRTLVYCTKVWNAPTWLRLPGNWDHVMLQIVTSTWFDKLNGEDAIAARATYTVNMRKGRFCKTDLKVKELKPVRVRAVRPPPKPKGRPGVALDPTVLAAAAAGTISIMEAARRLGVDRKTVRSRIAAPDGKGA
jgi:hypothetical protein